MHEPMRIEVSDAVRAASLVYDLSTFHPEIVPVDGCVEIRIELIAHNPEERISQVLSRIDAWLSRSGEQAVRVHLDGHAYTLNASPERRERC